MKKIILLTLVLIMSVSVVSAGIISWTVEKQLAETLSDLKGDLTSDSIKYIAIRQSVEDMLASQGSNITSEDETKLNALVIEIQDVVNATDDLTTKLTLHFPTIQ